MWLIIDHICKRINNNKLRLISQCSFFLVHYDNPMSIIIIFQITMHRCVWSSTFLPLYDFTAAAVWSCQRGHGGGHPEDMWECQWSQTWGEQRYGSALQLPIWDSFAMLQRDADMTKNLRPSASLTSVYLSLQPWHDATSASPQNPPTFKPHSHHYFSCFIQLSLFAPPCIV